MESRSWKNSDATTRTSSSFKMQNMKHTKMGVAAIYFSPFGHKNVIIKPTGWRGSKVHICFLLSRYGEVGFLRLLWLF